MVHSKEYDLIAGRNCARFTYHGVPRVVRVISIKDGNLTGYETKRGGRICNVRFANVKSFRIDRIKGGNIQFASR